MWLQTLLALMILVSPFYVMGGHHDVLQAGESEVDRYQQWELDYDDDVNENNSSNHSTTTTPNVNSTTTIPDDNSTTTIPPDENSTTPTDDNVTSTPSPKLMEPTATEVILYAVLAMPALVFSCTASLYLRPTVFLAGGGSLGYAFYVFSPLFFKTTEFCCGSHGTLFGHVIVSCAVGLVGGLLALWVLKIGLFFVGAATGVVIGMGILCIPLVAHNSFFGHQYAYAVYYAGFGMAFGILAVFLKRAAIVFVTALSGTFLFMLGVDYFVKSNFTALLKELLVDVERKMKSEFEGNAEPLLRNNLEPGKIERIMLGSWLCAFVLAMILQILLLRHVNRKKNAECDNADYSEVRAAERQRIVDKYSMGSRSRRKRGSRSNRGARNNGNDDVELLMNC